MRQPKNMACMAIPLMVVLRLAAQRKGMAIHMNAEKTGALIAEVRREQNMTQKELAELLHVTDRAVSKWERGLSFPDVSLLEPLADALGLTLTELMDGERAQQPEEADERPLREVLALSKAALRSKAVKLRLFAASACVLALILLGMGAYRLWNSPDHPAHANTLKSIPLTQKEETLAQLSNSAVCKYRYTLTQDVQNVRAVYEVWTEDGMVDEGKLWQRGAESSIPLDYRGTFLFGCKFADAFGYDGKDTEEAHIELSWLLPSRGIIGQPVPLPYEAPGNVLTMAHDTPHKNGEGNAALLLLLEFMAKNSYTPAEDNAMKQFVLTASRGDEPPVSPGGYTVAIWLEVER